MTTRKRRVSDLELLQLLIDAVAAKYSADSTRAGVVLSNIGIAEAKPCRYYASVCRYPDGEMGKKVIVTYTLSTKSLGDAIQMLSHTWMQLVQPRERETLDRLKAALEARG